MAKRPDKSGRIVDAALAIAARGEWRKASLAAIASEAGLTLLDVYETFRSKSAILDAFRQRIDRAVLAGDSAEGERPRDRLFDTLMRRFDALTPYKDALRALSRDGARDPMAALLHGATLIGSMGWMLEASGVDSSGLRGTARAHLLVVIWASTMRVWLADETPDMVKTMAALDRRLRNAENWLGLGTPQDSSPTAEAAG